MPLQSVDWTCSACSLAWTLRATAQDTTASEWDMVAAIGTPTNINSTYGLMDAEGSQLRRVLSDYALDSNQGWLTFDEAFVIAEQYTGMMSGGNWYHWVAIRGTREGTLWIANSSPGYKGVYDTLTRDDFNRLGPFSVVWVADFL